MRPSTVLVRLIAAAVGLVITPIGLGLLSAGGLAWFQASSRYQGGIDATLAGPMALQAAGIALLILVVLTGVWSSAGLLTAGALTLVPIAFALVPSLWVSAYQLPFPREWMDGASYGVPTMLLPVLGGMGLALWFSRHRPSRSIALHITGLFVAPPLLLAGAWMLTLAVARSLTSLRQFELGPAPDAAGLLLGGALLIVAGVFLTRWSPFALLLPALCLLLVTALSVLPAGGLFDIIGVLGPDTGVAGLAVLTMGTGAAAALLYAAFTAVLVRTRARTAPVHPHPTYGTGADGPGPVEPPSQTWP